MKFLYYIITILLLLACSTTKNISKQSCAKGVVTLVDSVATKAEKDSTGEKSSSSIFRIADETCDSIVDEVWTSVTKTWTDSTGATYTETKERGKRRISFRSNKTSGSAENSNVSREEKKSNIEAASLSRASISNETCKTSEVTKDTLYWSRPFGGGVFFMLLAAVIHVYWRYSKR